METRLTQAEWLTQGLRTLAREGAGALKVGAMAAALEVSRGSFYWHFRDIADFRAQLLQTWQARSTDQVIEEMDARRGDPDRLKWLMKRAFTGKRDLDRAIRSWAAEDPAVAAIVAAVDARRVTYIARLLAAAGVAAPRARARAAFLYWAYLGQPIVMDERHSSITAAALDEISTLFAG